ncbi:MAG: hypothetical protein CVT66_07315 [Actinobacteria bacterium HGW-Actinobacteria-6]|nr:MAG: hypothetical protein CVT66_07315 [Actinobacteria bacterium HGW-Actinobacteria-6]
MRMFKKDEGFTLVELMVVVLIIGILVAIAIPVFNSASESARLRTCQSNQRTIEGAVQQYLASNPTLTWASSVINTTNTLTSGAAPYIKTAPTCPSAVAGTNFYGVNASGTVTADNLATGGTAPATWTTTTGHTHF